MKIINSIILVSFFLNLPFQDIYGQEDSITIENTTENISDSDYKLKKKYKYLDIKLRKERTLFKVGVTPFNSFSFSGNSSSRAFSGSLSAEQKINPSLSIILENTFDYKLHERNHQWKLESTLNIGMRYYYSMKKQIANSVSANNFHAAYISLKLKHCYRNTKGKYTDPYASVTQLPQGIPVLIGQEYSLKTSDPFLDLSWGIQRRFGKWGFIDASIYAGLQYFELTYGLNITLGLGLGF